MHYPIRPLRHDSSPTLGVIAAEWVTTSAHTTLQTSDKEWVTMGLESIYACVHIAGAPSNERSISRGTSEHVSLVI
jgi:hypothetical protein